MKLNKRKAKEAGNTIDKPSKKSVNEETVKVLSNKNNTNSVRVNTSLKRKDVKESGGPTEKRPKKFQKNILKTKNQPWKGKNVKSFNSKQKPEKPNWNKIKSDKQKLKEKRKESSKSQFSSFKEIKAIWEKMRRHDCPADARSRMCAELMKLVEGNLMAVIRTHDISRVVQTLVKYGSPEMRVKIVDELISDMLVLARCAYSVFLVKALFRYSPSSSRRKIIDKLCGSFLKLLRSKISCNLADEIYVKYSTCEEKTRMRKEFYGNLLSDNDETSLAAMDDKDETRKAVLTTTKSILRKLTDKTNCLGSRLVQSVLYDFLRNCSENDKKEMLDDLKPHMGMLLRTREGAMVAGLVLRQSSNKEKKAFVKELKSKPLSECHGLVLMTLFDTVDDTVLLKKALIPDILSNLEELVKCKFGQKIILYLIAHRDPKFFHPKDIEWLKESETSSSAKKDPELRLKELQEAVIKPISEFIVNNVKLCLSTPPICMFTLGIIKHLTGDFLKPVHEAVSSYIIEQSTSKSDFSSIVEDIGVGNFMSQLVKHELSSGSKSTFVTCLCSELTKEVIMEWLKSNRGRFTLIKVLEADSEMATESLKPLMDAKVQNALMKCEENEGTTLLKKLLKSNGLIK